MNTKKVERKHDLFYEFEEFLSEKVHCIYHLSESDFEEQLCDL